MPQGPIAVQTSGRKSSGVTAPTGLGYLGNEQLVAASLPDLAESGLAGRLMTGANPSGVTTTVALATTYVGLCLSNPAGSGVNLVLLRAQALLEVAPAAITPIGLITGFAAGGITAHTTPLTPVNSNAGGAAPVAKLDSAATLVGTPAWARWIGVTPGATSPVSFDFDMSGAFVIPPGGYVAIGTLIAGPTSGFLGSFQWLEVPSAAS